MSGNVSVAGVRSVTGADTGHGHRDLGPGAAHWQGVDTVVIISVAGLAVEASLAKFRDVGDLNGKLLRLEVNVISAIAWLWYLDIKGCGGVYGNVQPFTEAWH